MAQEFCVENDLCSSATAKKKKKKSKKKTKAEKKAEKKAKKAAAKAAKQQGKKKKKKKQQHSPAGGRDDGAGVPEGMARQLEMIEQAHAKGESPEQLREKVRPVPLMLLELYYPAANMQETGQETGQEAGQQAGRCAGREEF